MTGITTTVLALIASPTSVQLFTEQQSVAHWISVNLGYSVWLFAAVSVAFAAQLIHLSDLLKQSPPPQKISALDQMLDVWTQLFIGIGVIWTAVGMRSALQSALGDPAAALADDADDVLRRLVDGGILLALSTTIVGAVGGYIMRLLKTLSVGADLQAFYALQDSRSVQDLVATAQRIEQQLSHQSPIKPVAAVKSHTP